jgi:hypothetical protein
LEREFVRIGRRFDFPFLKKSVLTRVPRYATFLLFLKKNGSRKFERMTLIINANLGLDYLTY